MPHPTQCSGATARSLPSTRMAPVGHASAQRRQEALRLRTTTHRLGCTASDWLSSFSKSPRMLSMDILPLWVNWHNEIRPPLRASRVAPRYPCQRSKRAESLRSWWFLPQIIVPKPTAQYGENTPLCQREGCAKSARQSRLLRLSHPTASPTVRTDVSWRQIQEISQHTGRRRLKQSGVVGHEQQGAGKGGQKALQGLDGMEIQGSWEGSSMMMSSGSSSIPRPSMSLRISPGLVPLAFH